MKIKLTAVLILLLTTIFLSSCEKEEGEGGTSTIAGKIWVQNYYQSTDVLIGEFWAEEEDVYLMYGNDTIYSDRTKTNYDGSYWFQYLHEGNYTIYVYSDDTSKTDRSQSGRIPIIHKLSINKARSSVIVPTITVRK